MIEPCCLNCTDKYFLCHATCEKYIIAKEKNERQIQARREENDKLNFIYSCRKSTLKKVENRKK